MTFRITSDLDAASAAVWARLHGQVADHDRPGWQHMDPEAVLRQWKYQWVGRQTEYYIAWDDDEPIAIMEISVGTRENLDKAQVSIDVMPQWRRRGVGRQLFDLAVERSKALGRNKILSHTAWSLPGILAHDGGAGPAFAQTMGFESANLPEVMRRLDLSTVDNDVLDGLLSKAKDKSSGYAVRQWIDTAPDDLVDDVAYLDGRLSTDAPMGDLDMDADQVDAARIREVEQTMKNRDRKNYHTGAVHVETGRLVAWTTINTGPDTPEHAWQFITIVDPDHRGHRLGALVKVENLRFFQANEPAVKRIDTFNAAENSYMISINEDMGFRAKFAFANWKRDV